MASSDTDISPAITSCEVETSPTSDKGHAQLPACTTEKTLSAASTSSSKPTRCINYCVSWFTYCFSSFFLLLANCLLPCKALHEQNLVGHVLSTHTHSSSILHRNLFFCAVLFAVLVIKADFRQNSAKPELEIMSLGMWLYGREQRVGGIFICLPSLNCYCALLLLEVLW